MLLCSDENAIVHWGDGEQRHGPDVELRRVDGVQMREEGEEGEADGQEDRREEDDDAADEDSAQAEVDLEAVWPVKSRQMSKKSFQIWCH